MINTRSYIFQYFQEAKSYFYREVTPEVQDAKDILSSTAQIAINLTDLQKTVAEKERNWQDAMGKARSEVAREMYQSRLDKIDDEALLQNPNARKDAARQVELEIKKMSPEQLSKELKATPTGKSAMLDRRISEISLALQALSTVQDVFEHGVQISSIVQDKIRKKRLKDAQVKTAGEITREAFQLGKEGEAKLIALDKEFASLKEGFNIGGFFKGLISGVKALFSKSAKLLERAKKL